MPDFVNTTTLDVVLSVNDASAPWVVLSRADAETALAIPRQYRKWTGSAVAEMTTGEKATVDAAIATAAKAASLEQVNGADRPDLLRALALLVLDELNAHAAKTNAILTAIDNATTLANLKTAVAAIADLPTRTVAQLKTALAGKMG